MPRIVQEKAQITEPYSDVDDAHGGWVSSESARKTKGTPSGLDAQFNYLPPGVVNADQAIADIRKQEISRGNLGQGDQFTTDVSEASLRQGYDKKKWSLTDDMTGRETSSFYDSIEVDGKTGFLERQNLLDRS